MNIEYNKNSKMVRFESLNAGDIFMFNDLVFVKTKEYIIGGLTDIKINAICLNDSSFSRIESSTLVKPLKGKLVIEEN